MQRVERGEVAAAGEGGLEHDVGGLARERELAELGYDASVAAQPIAEVRVHAG